MSYLVAMEFDLYFLYFFINLRLCFPSHGVLRHWQSSLSQPLEPRRTEKKHTPFQSDTELDTSSSLYQNNYSNFIKELRAARIYISLALVLTETKVKQRPAPLCASCSVSRRGFASITDIRVGRADCSSGTSFAVLPSKP